MKIDPYLHFNGNCAEAIEWYEKAFNTKVSQVMRYGDAPAEDGYEIEPGTENFIGHATLQVGETGLMLCDAPDEEHRFGTGISLHISFDDIDSLKVAFDTLKDGGKVLMEIAPTFWSENFGIVTDKFGVHWMFSA